MNTIIENMRDGSVDFETGWIGNGNWFDRAPHLELAMAGLGAVSKEYIREAMRDRDPEVRRILRRIMRDPAAMAAQAEQDVAEMAHPTGKVIVFKAIARKLAPKAQAIENAVVAAMPDKNTEEGRVAKMIIETSDNPSRDLDQYYKAIALDAAGVDAETGTDADNWTFDETFSGIGALGKPKWLKKVQKVIKKVASNKIVKAIAITAAVVVAAPYAIAAVKAVGGAVVGGVKSLFGGGAPPRTDQTGTDFGAKNVPEGPGFDPDKVYQPASTVPDSGGGFETATSVFGPPKEQSSGLPWDKIVGYAAAAGGAIIKARRQAAKARAQGDPNAAVYEQQAQAEHDRAVSVLVQQGVPQAQAEQAVTQAEQQTAAQTPEEPSAPGASASAPAAAGGMLTWVFVGGAILLATRGGGGRSKRRRR